MVIYLNDAMQQLITLKGNSRETITKEDLREYVIAGAAKRLRPKLMTALGMNAQSFTMTIAGHSRRVALADPAIPTGGEHDRRVVAAVRVG